MQLDAEDELNVAVEQLQRAASMIKQQRSIEAKMWQKRIQELSEENDLLQNQLVELQNENRQIKANYQSQSAEIESLRALNASLTRTLQSKDQEIQRYINFNQNLKGLIDQNTVDSVPISPSLPPSQQPTTRQVPPTSNTSFSSYSPISNPKYYMNSPSKPSAIPTANRYISPMQDYNMPENSPSPSINHQISSIQNQSTPTATASKSSIFIKAAKEELTYSDFNQMINEIKLYNKHNQTREETIKHVERLLCPTHRALFEQFLPMISGI